MKQRFENRQSGTIRMVLLAVIIPSAALSWFAVPSVISDDELSAVAKVFLSLFLGLGCGVVLPAMALGTKAYLQIHDSHLSAGANPFTKIDIGKDSIRRVEARTIDTWSDFRGFGIKGTKKRRLYGYSGNEAVVISYVYISDGVLEQRELYFLHHDNRKLAAQLSRWAGR